MMSMLEKNDIWTSLAETGKAYAIYIFDDMWKELLADAREEGVTLERRLLADGETHAIYLRRARV